MKTTLLLCALLSAAVALPRSAAAQAKDNRPTVAILYFDYTGKSEELGVLRKGLAQMLISDLSELPGVRIVERDRLQEILEELKLGQSGKIDPQSAARVGKLLGARYMVMGGYFDLMGMLRADARVVEVETGRIVQSVGGNGKPGDFLSLEQKLSGEIGQILGTKLTMASASPAASPSPVRAPSERKVKPPTRLSTKTAVSYAKALDAKDKGDKATARAELKKVVEEQPDFKLAALDLDRLMQ